MMVDVCSVLYHISLRMLVYVTLTVRHKVADHLEANAALYRDFLCQPVPSENDDGNADTEQPTAEDECINSVADPQLQTELKWQNKTGSLVQLLICSVRKSVFYLATIPCFQ